VIRRSTNGVDWPTTHAPVYNTYNYGGIAVGAGNFVAVSATEGVWSPDGVTWTKGITGFTDINVRKVGYGTYQGTGRFVVVAEGNTSLIVVSSDGGRTFWRPTSYPDACLGSLMYMGDILGGNEILLIVTQEANACRSTDGGR